MTEVHVGRIKSLTWKVTGLNRINSCQKKQTNKQKTLMPGLESRDWWVEELANSPHSSSAGRLHVATVTYPLFNLQITKAGEAPGNEAGSPASILQWHIFQLKISYEITSCL